MDKKEQTIQAYNNNAEEIAKKFEGFDRSKDINELFALIGKKNPRVLEIGCAGGRDAAVFLQKTTDFLAIDASQKLLDIAKNRLPKGKFVLADVEKYEFPNELDIIYASASLIHTNKQVLREVFQRIYYALYPGGLFRITMKHADKYVEITKETPFGTRTYYHFSEEELLDLGNCFDEVLMSEVRFVKGQNWVEILFKKAISI